MAVGNYIEAMLWMAAAEELSIQSVPPAALRRFGKDWNDSNEYLA